MKPVVEQIGLEEAGKSLLSFKRRETEFRPYWHHHPELELTLITKGRGTRFVGDSIMPYGPKDLVLIGKDVPHHWVSLNEKDKLIQEAVVVQFPEGIFDSFPECKSMKKLFKDSQRGLWYPEPPKEFCQRLWSIDEVADPLKISLLLELLYQLSLSSKNKALASPSYQSPQGKREDQSKASRINAYVLENLHERLSVERMAEQANMQVPSFCRWFKKSMGQTFVSFVNSARIEEACQLLITMDWPVSEVAYRTGFESVSHFNRVFKRLKLVAPTAFREEKKRM